MRVARAQNLMVISSDPLSQIALECGFADQSHFSNCFRKVIGERPGAWRAQRPKRKTDSQGPARYSLIPAALD
jgi:transcriptional regulator GlxA family with amidase domain